MAQINTSTITAAERGSLSARAMIERAMIEAIVGTIKPGRVRGPKEEKQRPPERFYGRPWKLPIDLRCPVPRDGRPRAADGGTSFHFRVSTVSRREETTRSPDSNRAAGHEAYLVNDRGQAGADRKLAERYLVEPKLGQPEAMTEGRAMLVRSSIGDTLAEREAFWNERWNCARRAGAELIEIFPPRGSTADWQALASDCQAPEIIRAMAATVAAGLESGKPQKKRIAVPVDAEGLRLWAVALGNRFGVHKAERMLHYRASRGGAVQDQFEFELPADLPLAEVTTVIDTLATKLQELGLAFTLVVHAPDARNDPRNLHVHMVLYRRRLRVGKDRTLDLSDPGEALRPGDITALLGEPLDRATMHHRALAAKDLMTLRRFYAELVNRELARVRADWRFDPRSYAEMGINKEPEGHLGNEAFTLLNAGVMTDLARENAVRSWRSAVQDSERQLAEEQAYHAARIEAWTRDLDAIPAPEAGDVAASIDRYCKTAERLHESASALARFELDEAMARSAADRLVRTSRELIELLKRPGKRWRDERDALARHRLAVAHLEEVDEALEPHRQPIAWQRDAAAQMRSELARIDAEITAAIAGKETEIQAAKPWLATTVLPPSRYPSRLRPSDLCDALIDHVFTQAGAASAVDPNRMLLVYKTTDGTGSMTITGLREADTELMLNPRWRPRLQAAFTRAYDIQRHAVDRLLAYVRQHGRETLERGRTRLGDPIEPTLIRLRDAYSRHPEFMTGLAAAEGDYRRRHNCVGAPAVSSWQDLDRGPPPSQDSADPSGPPAPALQPELQVARASSKLLKEISKPVDQGRAKPIVEGAGTIGTRHMEAVRQQVTVPEPDAPFNGRAAEAPVKQVVGRGGPATSPPSGEHRAIEPALPVQVAVPTIPIVKPATPVQVPITLPVKAITAELPDPIDAVPTTASVDKELGQAGTSQSQHTLSEIPHHAAPQLAPDVAHMASPPPAPQVPSETTPEPTAEAVRPDSAPAPSKAQTDQRFPTTPPLRAGKIRKAASLDGAQRPTDFLRAHMAKGTTGLDRNTVLATWQDRIHGWAGKARRTENEFARSLHLKDACRMAERGDFDMALDPAGQLHLFVRTNEAEALIRHLRDMPEGRRSLRMIAADLPPLADRRSFLTITVAPDAGRDDSSYLHTWPKGRERE